MTRRFLELTRRSASALLLMAASSAPAAGQVILNKVVEVGDPAPGSGGLLFEAFGTHPVVQALGVEDLPPRIDGSGNVTFHAFMGDDGIPDPGPTYPPTQPSGIFRTVGGELQPIAQAGDPAPGTAADFTGFPSTFFPSTPRLADGRAVFPAAAGGSSGLWSDLFGPLAPLALIGDPLPEIAAGATLGSISAWGAEPGISFFSAAIDNLAPDDPRPLGLWRDLGAGREAVIHTGMPAPGFRDGVVFGTTAITFQTGPFGSFDFNDSFETAVTGFVTGSRIEADGDEGIWIEGPDGLELVLEEGDTAPGEFGSRAIFHSGAYSTFSGIRLNNAGEVLFKAEVDPRFSARHPTLYTIRDGSLQLFVKGSQEGFVADALPGDPAPGTEFNFLFLGSADLNDRGDIAFRAAINSTTDPFATLDSGIWVDRGAGLELVAVDMGPVPGVPGETIDRISGMALERDGTVVFSAFYGVSPNRTEAIFRQDPGGSTMLLLEVGGQADIDGLGTDIRTIAGIDFELAGSSEAGEKAFEVAFTDGSIGIYTAQILAPPPPPPDCGDGWCDPDEDPCSCALDCGGPPATELYCADLVDDDCDGAIDCADPDCSLDPVCSVPECQPKAAACGLDADCCSGKCRNGACRG